MRSLGRRSISVRAALDEGEIEAALELRIRVFVGEQGVSREGELDGLDGEALHLVALDRETVIGTCRLRFAGGDCKLERMAVDKPRRSEGIGALIIEAAEEEARGRNASQVLLHGQLQARRFYERCGFTAVSEEVLIEEGISHVRMTKEI